MDGASIVINLTLFVVLFLAILSNMQRVDRLRRRVNDMNVGTSYNGYRSDLLISDTNRPAPSKSHFVQISSVAAESDIPSDATTGFVVDVQNSPSSRLFVADLMENTVTSLFRPDTNVVYRLVSVRSKPALTDSWSAADASHRFFLVNIRINSGEDTQAIVGEKEIEASKMFTITTSPATLPGNNVSR